MDGKELLSQSDLQSFYQHQQQQQHRAALGGGGGAHSPSSLAGMHSVIRPMPNMNMSATAILNSISGGSLAGMQFQMDTAPPPLLHNNTMGGSVSGSASGTVPSGPPPHAEPVKRKRGRPRKYGPDGTMKAAASAAQQQHLVSVPPRMGSMSGTEMMAGPGMEDPAQKKRRGRPPGTGKKQHPSPSVGNAFAGSAGTSFTPHIITVSPSEDVMAKIVAFANQSSRAVCVLSAMGSVSRVILRHPGDASPMSRVHTPQPYKNPAIYEGFYEILSLTGSYNLAEGSQSQGQQTGGLSVTLCSPERNVIGGVLGGSLVAASTVQVVLGSFHQGGSRSKSKKAAKQAAFSPDSLTGGQDASPSSGHNQQNLTPPSVTGGWPTSGIFDTRNSSIDINSSRG
ncbi:AT-hook motif nuclear-localized protein 13 [Dichanthelium oligosanthes]|uniref:AT-hook motif nuclear-localized protein n=1 Tax=Dichanthelium oligosanthes TaxID=888268 RepID=A0A1E5VXD5_9POAL|nr:AT-hook motif nuclear-localized protein 13 [Dichanthelium oligosanthes]